MKSDFSIGNVVEYSPISNCSLTHFNIVLGVIIAIDERENVSFITVRQISESSKYSKEDYPIGNIGTIGYGGCWRSLDKIKLIKRRYEMNEIIVEMFPKTKDAVLIDKWFGDRLNDPIFKMLLQGKESELLAEAQKSEKKELEKTK